MHQMSPLLRGRMVCPVCHAQGLLEAEPGHQGYVIRTAAMDAYAAGNRNGVEKQSRCIAAYVKIKNGVDVKDREELSGRLGRAFMAGIEVLDADVAVEKSLLRP